MSLRAEKIRIGKFAALEFTVHARPSLRLRLVLWLRENGFAVELKGDGGGRPPLRSDCYGLLAGATSAGAFSDCAAGRSVAGAGLDLLSEPSLFGASCAEENFLKDMRNAFSFMAAMICRHQIYGPSVLVLQ